MWLSGKESVSSARDTDLILGLGRFREEGNGSSLQYSCLENPLERGAWQIITQGVTKELDMT